MTVAQSPQLGEVHLLWHNQRRPHEEQAGQKVKDEQEVQHQQEVVYTSEMLQWLNAIRSDKVAKENEFSHTKYTFRDI
ncbi:hypothetical protein TNCV_4027811 [Trichonephila clavipes]|nr:hypothetical protein TNCV_4027811 [Trichonephila clavipes]